MTVSNSPKYVDSSKEIQDAFRVEECRGELKIARFGIWVCGLAVFFSIFTGLVLHARLGLWLGLLSLSYVLYYSALATALRRGWYRPWIKFVSGTLEVSGATFVACIDTAHISAAYALTSAPPFIYFIAIFITALRFNRWLCVYAGTLAAIQSAGLYLALYHRIPSDLMGILPSIGPEVFLQRSGYLFFGGLVAASISRTADRLVRAVTQELEQRRHLRWLFGRYVSDEVADLAVARGLGTQGELREVTVLCTDIRDFSRYSRLHHPQNVVATLNASFERQCEIIAAHGGRVDKFLGDGILAIFGAPIALDDHVTQAAMAAMALRALEGSRAPSPAPDSGSSGPGQPDPAELDELESPPLRLGVAIHTGQVLVGEVGSAERLEYTAIGEAVNLTFRIESLNRRFGTQVLISEAARQRLGTRAKIVAREPTLLQGWDAAIPTYELLELTSKPAARAD